MFTQHLINARAMAKRAIESRERIYQGIAEARSRYALRRGRKDYASLTAEDEIQRWMTSQKAKQIIADNQWNMKQADMYSNLAAAEGIENILTEMRKQTALLEMIAGVRARPRRAS
jgi:uncharacterized protein YaiL (DUF2058 family)